MLGFFLLVVSSQGSVELLRPSTPPPASSPLTMNETSDVRLGSRSFGTVFTSEGCYFQSGKSIVKGQGWSLATRDHRDKNHRSRLHIQAHPPLLVLEGALTRLEIGNLACESDPMRAGDTPIWLSLSDREASFADHKVPNRQWKSLHRWTIVFP
jgi:hypothetical protein